MNEFEDLVEGTPGVIGAPRSSRSAKVPGMTGPDSRRRALAEKDPGVLRTVGKTREEWIAYGRALGEDEAARRRETGDEADQRVRRAMHYAAWEWDGKPLGKSAEYHAEFGIRELNLTLSHDRPPAEQNGSR